MDTAHVWPWLIVIECSSVALNCFTLSRLNVDHKPRRLVQPVLRGCPLSRVAGQETCENLPQIRPPITVLADCVKHRVTFLLTRRKNAQTRERSSGEQGRKQPSDSNS